MLWKSWRVSLLHHLQFCIGFGFWTQLDCKTKGMLRYLLKLRVVICYGCNALHKYLIVFLKCLSYPRVTMQQFMFWRVYHHCLRKDWMRRILPFRWWRRFHRCLFWWIVVREIIDIMQMLVTLISVIEGSWPLELGDSFLVGDGSHLCNNQVYMWEFMGMMAQIIEIGSY